MAVHKPPTTDGTLSQLPADKLAAWSKTPYRILLPEHVPAGYKLTDYDLMVGEKLEETIIYLRYEHPKTKAYFVIEMASDGIGGPMFTLKDGNISDPTSYLTTDSPVLGKVKFEVLRKKGERQFHCDWVEIKDGKFPKFIYTYGDNMDAAEGKRIFENLRVLESFQPVELILRFPF